jgi:hypothetical protein
MAKRRMHLVSDKKTKKMYDKFFVLMCDDNIYEFDLVNHEIYKDNDWIDVVKLDGTEMDSFLIHNVIRVRFVHTEKKSSMQQDIPSLKSVPPGNDAA